MNEQEPLPLGLRLRRARLTASLSQKELARRAGVSQPLVSYYERSAGEPDGPGLSQIAGVLGISLSAPAGVGPGPAQPAPSRSWLSTYRAALMRSLDQCGLDVAVLDQPAVQPGGDVAFSIDFGSHLLLAVLDGTGDGDQACVTALIESAAILAIAGAQRGVLWPDQLLDAVHSMPERFGARTLASAFVALLDRKHGELSWARDGFPPPWIRSGPRTVSHVGERARRIEAGRLPLRDDWLLLIATDGVAYSPSRRQNTLWETRDLRQLVSRARNPAELLAMLSKRLIHEPQPGRADDRLALAVSGRVQP